MNAHSGQIRQVLKDYADRYLRLSEEDLDALCGACEKIQVRKKEYLLQPGEVCRYQYFVLEGCFRSYYFDEKGNEQILHFAIEHWWLTDYESWTNEQATDLYIQALEDASVLKVRKADLISTFTLHPNLERLFRIIAEKTLIAAQNRLKFMLSMKREEMLHGFLESTSTFSARVPQYMVASYLGITPEFLSMIRARKKETKK